ncbi:hypothetical protein AB0436_02895 [Streptomyces sp. NPDC051322]|uniref:scabin-related ADP-ribosyltransferase n=1 Tax=Streptomyces sp. NPDC051322 TaxID=3154645 RepID=UPI00344B97F4
MCIGAAIGGVLGGGIYALTHQDDFDWGDFAVATGKGALIGAGAAFLAPAGAGVAAGLGLEGGAGLATTIGVNAAVGAGYTWAINTVQCQPTTPTDLLLGAGGGALGSLAGPAWRWGKGLLGAPSKVNPFADIDVKPSAIVEPKRVYRGDARHPSVVFPEGFSPKGTNTDILQYGLYDTPSAWVGTTTRESTASAFPQSAKGETWVYEINSPGTGIRVNKVLPFSYVFKSETEIIFPRGIDPSHILRARRWSYNFPTGETFDNPGYGHQ